MTNDPNGHAMGVGTDKGQKREKSSRCLGFWGSGLSCFDLKRGVSGLLKLLVTFHKMQYILLVFKAASQAISLAAIWESLT